MTTENLEINSNPSYIFFLENSLLPYPTKDFLKKFGNETTAQFHKRVINIFDIHMQHFVPKPGSNYPSPDLLHAFNTKHLEVKQSQIMDGGYGLFTKVLIQKGDPIIIYGGRIADPTGTYSIPYGLQLGFPHNSFCVDASPHAQQNKDLKSKLLLAGRMNEYIWDASKNNVKGLHNGLIVAQVNIQANSELFLDYGEDYDWTSVGLLGVQQFALDLEALESIFKVTVDIMEVWEVKYTIQNLTKQRIKNWRKPSIQWHIQLHHL
jgi:hypothetical protein